MTIEELEKKVSDLEKLLLLSMENQKKTWEALTGLIEKQIDDNLTTNENFKAQEELMKKIITSHNELTNEFNKHILEHKFTSGINNYLSAEGFND